MQSPEGETESGTPGGTGAAAGAVSGEPGGTAVGADAPPRRIKEYTSPDIVVSFEARRCIHSGNCTRGLPQVFNTRNRPWIQPNAADAETIAEIVRRCPTGALHYRRLDGGADETVPEHVEITEQRDGPLYIRGRVRIYDADGSLLVDDSRVALCRCGASSNKPFCDGTHERIGFKTSGDESHGR